VGELFRKGYEMKAGFSESINPQSAIRNPGAPLKAKH
jgi:hypothetical protein